MTHRSWTATEIACLRCDYPDTPTDELAARLGCTTGQLYRKAYKLGLFKSAAYMASPHACRLRRGDNVGAATRFKPGHRPHNTGKTGWRPGGNAVKTQFRPGNRPQTWKPIGAERSMQGYRQRKVTDTGYTPHDWIAVHVLLWREQHGPIPPGHIVVFRNGNKQDIRIENLELISRGENMRRNTIHRYPPALKDSIRLAAKLRRRISEKQD